MGHICAVYGRKTIYARPLSGEIKRRCTPRALGLLIRFNLSALKYPEQNAPTLLTRRVRVVVVL